MVASPGLERVKRNTRNAWRRKTRHLWNLHDPSAVGLHQKDVCFGVFFVVSEPGLIPLLFGDERALVFDDEIACRSVGV